MTMQESTRRTATLRTVDDRPLDPEGVKLWEKSWYALARKDFWTYRLLTRPNLIKGWWQQEVADNLTQFWYDLKAGKRPKLVLGAPPQHGKSDTMKDFCAWAAGKDPDGKTLFSSYADELGMSCNLHMQRIMAAPAYRAIFPKTRLFGGEDSEGSGHRRRTTTFLEFVGHNGSFRNTTINGKINGFGLDLGVIDDPIKGRAEAQSLVIRDKTWNWLSDDFFNRFSDRAGMVMIQTRWHVDDPTGRWLERFPGTRVLNFKAIADRRELWRKKGEALFPEHKSLDFLLERKKLLTESSWAALFQQSPFQVGGGMFPIEKLHAVPMMFGRTDIRRSVRYWDKAGCLIAGTMVTTDRGYVPIEQIKAGDRVLTRAGFRRVTRAWMTKRTDELTTVLFSNGAILGGTPDHPVFTGTNGWVTMDNLHCDHQAVGEPSWLMWRNVSSKVAATHATRTLRTRTSGGISSVWNGLNSRSGTSSVRSTETCGSPFTAPSPLAIMSTIRTTSGTKTTLRTWSACRRQPIADCMELSQSSSASLGTGTRPPTASEFEPWLWPLLDKHARSSVLIAARQPSCAVPRPCSANAMPAAESVGATARASGVPVYDLTVEGEHEFFANGILVHNSEDSGAYTAGVLMHLMMDGRYIIEHVVRGQWGALDREQRIKFWAEHDRASCSAGTYEVLVEQEPGSGGKESAEATIRNLGGYRAYADKVTGKKEIRAEPFAAQVQGSNVWLVAGGWHRDYLDEMESYPFGKAKDQIDASSGAFNRITAGAGYNLFAEGLYD